MRNATAVVGKSGWITCLRSERDWPLAARRISAEGQRYRFSDWKQPDIDVISPGARYRLPPGSDDLQTVALPTGRGIRSISSRLSIWNPSFATAVDAVECAVEIQTALRTENAGVSPGRPMEFRIGINLGDVVTEGREIYGDRRSPARIRPETAKYATQASA